jgi:hypothetical protein
LPDFGEIGHAGPDLGDFLDRALVRLGVCGGQDLDYSLLVVYERNFTFRSLSLPGVYLLSVESTSENFFESCFVSCFILQAATCCELKGDKLKVS